MSFFDFGFYEIIVWVAVVVMCLVTVGCRNIPLRKRGGLGQPLPNPIALIFPVVFFTLMAALRTEVGDTVYYEYSFEMMPDHNDVPFSLFFTGMFSFFQNIIRNITDDPQWLIAFSSIFSIPAPLFILYKYSHPFEMSIFLFVAYGYFGGMMNGMRQYMAAAILICGTKYLFSMKKSAFFKYAVFVLLAYCMHSSALVMLPVFFVVRRKAWKTSSYVLIGASVVCVLAFDKIMPSFLSALEDTSYSVYSKNEWFTNGVEGGSNIFRVLVSVAPIVLAYFNRDRVKRLGHIGDILINMAFINSAIYILSLYNWIFSRVAIYMMIYYIILTVWVIYNGVSQKDKGIYCTLFYLLYFIYSRWLSYQIYFYTSDYFFPGRKLFG